MEYSILKEKTPQTTINNIKKILNSINIDIKEDIIKYKHNNKYNPSSLKISVTNNKSYSTNGKGTSLLNAKASAYAEFMERLQSQFLFLLKNEDYIYAPDEEIIYTSSLNANEIYKYFQNTDLLLKINLLANQDILEDNKTVLVPFYSYGTNTTIKLPIYIISLLQGSTGIAAGNTLEEAMVQGFSEICERYAQTRIINEKISLPNIPLKYFIKYKRIKGLIKLFQKNGYSVLIKDASLNLNIPVVCAVIYDKKQKTVSLKFGAHPSLPIAIERCLTEFAQGIDITNNNKNFAFESFVSETGLQYTIEEKNLNFLNQKIQKSTVFIENCKYIREQFYTKNTNYKFCSSAWMRENLKTNNKLCLKFLINNLNKISKDIYIRDISFLNFPSVIISIPKMTFTIDKNLKKRTEYKIKLLNYIKQGMPENKDSVKFLFDALISQGPPIFYRDFKSISQLPNENILLLCSIILEDYNNIKKYSECIIQNRKSYEVYKESFIKKIIIANKFFNMKSKGIAHKNIVEYLYLTFEKKDIDNFLLFIKFLSFSQIKEIILNYNKNNEFLHENKEIECYNIINKLIQKQKSNIINQQKISEIFYNSHL